MKKGYLIITLALLACSCGVAAETLRDPTRPDYVPESQKIQQKKASNPELHSPKSNTSAPFSHGLTLEQTVVSSSRRLAVINGHTYRLGSHLKGAKLVEIFSDRVVFEKSGEQYQLNLYQPVNIKEVTGK